MTVCEYFARPESNPLLESICPDKRLTLDLFNRVISLFTDRDSMISECFQNRNEYTADFSPRNTCKFMHAVDWRRLTGDGAFFRRLIGAWANYPKLFIPISHQVDEHSVSFELLVVVFEEKMIYYLDPFLKYDQPLSPADFAKRRQMSSAINNALGHTARCFTSTY